MLPMKRRPGRPPMDPSDRKRGLNVSLPPALIREVEEVAAERGVRISPIVQEFIERGLLEREIRRRREMQEVA